MFRKTMRSFGGEFIRRTSDSHTSRTIQITAMRMITPNQLMPTNKTSSDEFRSNLDGSSFGNAPCRSRLRPDLRLFVLHAAGGHERQSHSGDSNKRLHDLPRWENLSGHFLRLSESHSFCGGEKEEAPLGARPGSEASVETIMSSLGLGRTRRGKHTPRTGQRRSPEAGSRRGLDCRTAYPQNSKEST